MTKPKTPPNTDDQITIWESPKTKLHSQWGCIRFDEWVSRELARIQRMGRSAHVRSNNGMMCLAKGIQA